MAVMLTRMPKTAIGRWWAEASNHPRVVAFAVCFVAALVLLATPWKKWSTGLLGVCGLELAIVAVSALVEYVNRRRFRQFFGVEPRNWNGRIVVPRYAINRGMLKNRIAQAAGASAVPETSGAPQHATAAVKAHFIEQKFGAAFGDLEAASAIAIAFQDEMFPVPQIVGDIPGQLQNDRAVRTWIAIGLLPNELTSKVLGKLHEYVEVRLDPNGITAGIRVPEFRDGMPVKGSMSAAVPYSYSDQTLQADTDYAVVGKLQIDGRRVVFCGGLTERGTAMIGIYLRSGGWSDLYSHADNSSPRGRHSIGRQPFVAIVKLSRSDAFDPKIEWAAAVPNAGGGVRAAAR